MKKYLTKWVFSIAPESPRTRGNSTYTFVSLVNPYKPNGTVSFERMMVVDEAWVKQNLGDIDLEGKELPGFLRQRLKERRKNNGRLYK